MRWIRRVWDGPFKTPPLQHPVSVGWVFLKIIETIWRALIVLCVLVALGGLALWISERNPLSSQIRASLNTSEDCRKDGYPLRAAFTNESNKTIGEIGVRVRVYERGKSEDVATYHGSTHDLHDIVRPGEEIAYCFPMPSLEPGSVGPYTALADVTYAYELSKDVPLSAVPPPLVRTNVVEGASVGPKPFWRKALDYAGALVAFALFASGGFGLISLWDRAFHTQLHEKMFETKKDEANRGCLAVIFLGFLNAAVVSAASYGLAAIGMYGWITSLDKWSRANGYADAGVILLTAIVCQWPWVILYFLPKSAEPSGASE